MQSVDFALVERITLPDAVLRAFPPSESDLFDAVRARASDAALKRIAKSEEFSRQESLSLLRSVAAGEVHPYGFQWFPWQALRSAMWSESIEESEEVLFVTAALLRWKGSPIGFYFELDDLQSMLAYQVFRGSPDLTEPFCRFVTHQIQQACSPHELPWTWAIGSLGASLLGALVELEEEALALAAGEWLMTYWIQDYGDLLWMQADYKESIAFEHLKPLPWWIREGRDFQSKLNKLWSDRIDCFAHLSKKFLP